MGTWRDFGGATAPHYETTEAHIVCPCGRDFFVDFSRPSPCPRCGREYKAEFSVRVYCREQPNAAAKGGA